MDRLMNVTLYLVLALALCTHSPQKYIMPLTLRRVRTTARRTCRHAIRLESMRRVVTKMHANARRMFL